MRWWRRGEVEVLTVSWKKSSESEFFTRRTARPGAGPGPCVTGVRSRSRTVARADVTRAPVQPARALTDAPSWWLQVRRSWCAVLRTELVIRKSLRSGHLSPAVAATAICRRTSADTGRCVYLVDVEQVQGSALDTFQWRRDHACRQRDGAGTALWRCEGLAFQATRAAWALLRIRSGRQWLRSRRRTRQSARSTPRHRSASYVAFVCRMAALESRRRRARVPPSRGLRHFPVPVDAPSVEGRAVPCEHSRAVTAAQTQSAGRGWPGVGRSAQGDPDSDDGRAGHDDESGRAASHRPDTGPMAA
jgi:hypothetical protein